MMRVLAGTVMATRSYQVSVSWNAALKTAVKAVYSLAKASALTIIDSSPYLAISIQPLVADPYLTRTPTLMSLVGPAVSSKVWSSTAYMGSPTMAWVMLAASNSKTPRRLTRTLLAPLAPVVLSTCSRATPARRKPLVSAAGAAQPAVLAHTRAPA